MLRPGPAFVLLFYLGFNLLVIGCKKTDPDPLADLSSDKIRVVQALNKVILPLQDADPTREFTELAPLDTVLAKAQVVGMGEGTHGTREFFRMKDRLFRYLVQKHGHQTIAFEANFGRCLQINRYIHGQEPTLKTATEAAKSMYFWTWATAEVRDLIDWLRDYNRSKPASEQISFYGFDCQYADDEFPIIRDFLVKVDPGSVPKIDSVSSLFNLTIGATSPAVAQEYAQKLPGLYTLFVTNETKWASLGSRQDYEVAKQAVRVLVQQQDLTVNGPCHRDEYMAENVQWLLNTLRIDKLSLWAHNHHIGNWTSYCNSPMMGAYLKKQLKGSYLAVGTSLTNGSFTAVDVSQGIGRLKSFSIRTEGVNNSFNYLLGKGQSANFALTLVQGQLGSVLTDWLSAQHPFFEAGAGFDESRSEHYYSITTLTGHFDLLIHFRDTTPTQLLP